MQLRLPLAAVLALQLLLVAAPSHSQDRAEASFHFAMARTHANEGDANAALTSFARAVELEPDEPFLRAEYADFLQRLRRNDDAVEQINVAAQLAPDNPDVLRVYGQIHFAASAQSPAALDNARRAFEKLRKSDPKDIGAMLNLAQIYSGLNQSGDAISVVQELVSYHPDNRQLNRILVEALRDAGRQDEAETVLQEILRLDDEALESRLELARIESERGNHTTAIEILSGAGSEIAIHPQLRSELAQEYHRRALSPGVGAKQRQQDLKQAEEMINEVVEQYPDALSALFTRARVLGQLQRFDEAAADLMKVREKVPDDVQTLRLLAGYLEQAGRIEEAAKLLSDNASRLAQSSEPDSVDSLKEQLVGLQAREGKWLEVAELSGEMLLARPPGPGRMALFELHVESLVRSEQSGNALDAIKREEQRFGAAPALALTRAEVYREIGKDAKAIKALQAPVLAKELKRNEVLRLANLLYELDQADSAEGALERHASQGDLDPLFAVGQFYSLRNDFERAVVYLERANELVDDDTGNGVKAELFFWTGQAYERTKRFDQAAASFESVLEIQPRHATTLNYLGYMWADIGRNLDRALELIESAIEQQPDNGAFLDSLGWVYYRLGRYEEAEKKLLDAVTRVPDDSTILEHLGDVRLALGFKNEARQAYEQALAINDEENVQAVREKLEKLKAEL